VVTADSANTRKTAAELRTGKTRKRSWITNRGKYFSLAHKILTSCGVHQTSFPIDVCGCLIGCNKSLPYYPL
jgi:hypothetical protein